MKVAIILKVITKGEPGFLMGDFANKTGTSVKGPGNQYYKMRTDTSREILHDEMNFLDENDLNDDNLIDDLLREINDNDDKEINDNTDVEEYKGKNPKERNESFRNDAETEAERMKRQLSLMGKYRK